MKVGLGTSSSGVVSDRISPRASVVLPAPSPTFTLVQTYDGPDFALAHFDLYRIVRPEEIFELGLDEALDQGAAIIEWPERLEGRLPTDRLDIVLTIEGDGRRARLRPHGAWEGRGLEF